MLRIFTGHENTDKERFIYDRVKERGGETLVLVPDQYTLVAEEQALRYLGTDCLFDVEITSMNRLGLRVLQQEGTESVRMLDKYGRFMLLSMIVRGKRDSFEIFRRPAGKLSFITMLSDFISEFKQQDCSFEDFMRLAEAGEADPIFSAKLRELGGVIEAYEAAVKDKYTDSEDFISNYVEAMKSSALLCGKTIWIYGYDSITAKFADAVTAIAGAADSVNFVINKNDSGLDKKLAAVLLKRAAETGGSGGAPEVSIEEIGREYRLPKSETVSRIADTLWKSVLPDEDIEANREFDPEDLTLVCAANPYYEAENAAAYVWHLIRDLGYRMSDIQIIANDEARVQPVVRRVFSEYGLELFADSTRDISGSAAVSFIINLLGFIRSRKASSYLFAALKTGLSGFSDSDTEDLENYARAYRIRGSMWDKPFKYGAEEIGSEAFERLEAMRQLISSAAAGLSAAAKAGTVSELTAGLRAFLEDRLGMSERVSQAAEAYEASGLPDEAQRMTQSYEKAMELLDQIDEIMGGSETDLAEFMDVYTAGLSDVKVGVIPPSADGLSIGTMIRTRPGRIRAVVILGANEGVLPMQPGTEGLFSVDEKEFFKRNDFELGGLDDLKMDEENAAMQRMMSRPSEKIYISWPLCDTEGGDANPSPVIETLRARFPRIDRDGLIKRDIISAGWEGGEALAAFNTADSGMRHLINHIKSGGGTAPDALSSALLKWYSDNRPDGLRTMLRAASYDNAPGALGRAQAIRLFGRSGERLVMSASSIDGYMSCPFRYFIDRGLRPKEERSFESDPRSVGDAYHECLMAVAGQLSASGALGSGIVPDDEELSRMVDSALDEISAGYRGGLFISAGSEKYRMSRIREICSAAAKAMAQQLCSGSVTAAQFEESFGRGGAFGPVRLESGGVEVLVEGKIDRADHLNVNGEDRIRIIDYKTGPDRLDLWKMRNGIKMQLMIYMISASGGGAEPAGMFYFNIKDTIEGANDKSAGQSAGIEAAEPSDSFRLKGVYINDEGVLAAMPAGVLSSEKGGLSREEFEAVRADVVSRITETAEGILSGSIGINPLKENNRLVCGSCGYKAICRRDRGYIKNGARSIPPAPKKEKD